jgi:phenylacetic acid degradation operon negative regulatory protein
VKTKTGEFLGLLLWSADKLMRPSFRNLTDSFESWSYRDGLQRRLLALERRRLVEARTGSPDERLYRLTAEGHLHALGGRDPQIQWSREWNGRWRLVVFDIPVARDSHRRRLRRYLRTRGFGCLQNSVWITPHPLEEEQRILAGAKIDVQSLLMLEARTCAGESDADIVAGAWDFERINRRYLRLIQILDQQPEGALRSEAGANALLRWATAEREAWLDAVTNDPLLPERLLPAGYMGQRAWQRRVEVLRQAHSHVHSFNCG